MERNNGLKIWVCQVHVSATECIKEIFMPRQFKLSP